MFLSSQPDTGISAPSGGQRARLLVPPLLLCLMCVCASRARAQVDTATIVGTLRDASGAVIPGACGPAPFTEQRPPARLLKRLV